MLPEALLVVALVFPQVQRAVLPLQIMVEGKTKAVCSAVAIERPFVVTEEHCLPESGPVLVDDVKAEVVAKYHGIVVLRPEAQKRGWQHVSVRSREPVIGEPVFAYGYAFAEFFVATTGRVAGFGKPDDEDPLYADINLIAGMSGGAIVDGSGRLVTLVRGTRTDGPGSPNGLSVSALNLWLREAIAQAKQKK